MRTERLASRPEDGLPALLHPGRMPAFWVCPQGLAFHDGLRLWLPEPKGWRRAPRHARLGCDGELTLDDRPAGPVGARSARKLRRFRGGMVWAADDFVYRVADGSPLRCIGTGPADHLEVGPGGAALWGTFALTHAAPPTGSERPIPPLAVDAWGARFSSDGRSVYGHCAITGDALAVDLRRGTEMGRWPDLSWADAGHHALQEGTLGRWEGLAEASWARRGSLLAGPAGAVWDLDRAERRATPGFGLGVTCALADGWLHAHWDTGMGFVADEDGLVRERLEVPIAEDDVLVGVAEERGSIYLRSAEGHLWKVASGTLPASVAPAPAIVAGFAVEGTYPGASGVAGWNEAGLLVLDVTATGSDDASRARQARGPMGAS